MELAQSLETTYIDQPSSIESSQMDVLNQISLEHLNMAIWQRRYSPAPKAIQELVDSQFSAIQCVFDRSESIETLGAYFDEHLNLSSPDAFYLYQDIMELAQAFISLCKDKVIGIRLERVTTDNCKAFHVDYISLRLLCTYHGRATDWLENTNVNRLGLGQNNNELVVRDWRKVRKMKIHWVGILKGENFANNTGRGIVHRSPQISGINGADRILLRMDTLERFGSHK